MQARNRYGDGQAMVKNYIIMCGGNYELYFRKPRQLSIVNKEVLVERTIRLLKENGIKNIAISSNYNDFDYLGVPILRHENNYKAETKTTTGNWCDAFYPTDEPTCYIFGDVYFSEDAIKTIVNTDTNDIEFFASKKPFAKCYPKNHEEPFALKVYNTKHLKEAIELTKQYEKEGKFWRKPIMWELWTVIKKAPLQTKPDRFPCDYIEINDYTSDIDRESDIKILEDCINYEHFLKGGFEMVKCEVIEGFTLGKFNELKNIERANADTPGRLFVGDKFECTEEMAKYLIDENALKKPFVKVIGVIPKEKPIKEVKEEVIEKPKKKKKSTK